MHKPVPWSSTWLACSCWVQSAAGSWHTGLSMATCALIVQVDREKKRAAAAAAREKREQAAKSWFGWMRGASKPTVRSWHSWRCGWPRRRHCCLPMHQCCWLSFVYFMPNPYLAARAHRSRADNSMQQDQEWNNQCNAFPDIVPRGGLSPGAGMSCDITSSAEARTSSNSVWGAHCPAAMVITKKQSAPGPPVAALPALPRHPVATVRRMRRMMRLQMRTRTWRGS